MASQLNSSCVEWSLWPGVLPSNQSFVEHGHLLPRNVRSDRSRFDAILAEPRSRAMLGNYLSHATLWAHLLAQAAAAKREEAWLIMEDDVWLAPQWTALLAGGVARVPSDWTIVQAVWFGGFYESAAVNPSVDAVRRAAFEPSAARLPGLSADAAQRLAAAPHDASSPKPPFPTGPYLGLQVSLVRAKGLACLLERLPALNVRGVTSVDSMAISADCPHRYALRAGNSNVRNWGVVEELAGWHTTRWAREVQRGVYAARAGCARAPSLVNCTAASLCTVSGNRFLMQGCASLPNVT